MTTQAQMRQRTAAAAREFAAGDRGAFKMLPPEALRFGAGRVALDPVRKSPAYAAARAQHRAQQSAAPAAPKPDVLAEALREGQRFNEAKARERALAVLFGCTTEQASRWLRTGKLD